MKKVVLGLTLLSLFCDDLPDITESIDGNPQLHMYTDDTTVHVSAPTFDLVASKLNEVLARLHTWCCENCLTPHRAKTEYMLFSGRRQLTGPKQAIKMGDYVMEVVTHIDNEGSGTGVLGHPTARKTRSWVIQNPGPRTPHCLRVYN